MFFRFRIFVSREVWVGEDGEPRKCFFFFLRLEGDMEGGTTHTYGSARKNTSRRL